jgi:hypothetical protein
MMVVGMAGLTEQQNRAHMSLWAISGGPLLLGANLTKLTVADLTTLTNPDVVRIDQDSLGLQSVKVAEPAPGLEVWAKPLSTIGERAVLLLNRTAAPAAIAVRFSDLGLREDSAAAVRNVWTQSDLGELDAGYSATVPAGDGVMLLVLGSEGPMTAYFPEEPKPAEPKPVDAKKEPVSAQGPPIAKNAPVKFAGVISKAPIARIRIAYINSDKATRFAELRVNGGAATRIAFPATGGDSNTGTLSIQSRLESRLDTNGAKNILIFSFPIESGLAIQSISLQ